VSHGPPLWTPTGPSSPHRETNNRMTKDMTDNGDDGDDDGDDDDNDWAVATREQQSVYCNIKL